MAYAAAGDRRREPVVREDGAPPAGLDVGGGYHAPPLVALGYHLVQQPRPVHVEGHVVELVQDQQPRLGYVGEQPVRRALPLGLAQPRHQPGRLPEPRGVARRRRGDPERAAVTGLVKVRWCGWRRIVVTSGEIFLTSIDGRRTRVVGMLSRRQLGPHARHCEVKYVAENERGVAPLLGRNAAGRVAAPEGGPGDCRKVRKILNGTVDAIDC